MSMLSDQAKQLRMIAGDDGDWVAGPISAVVLREAADTIESLRDRLQADVLGSGTCRLEETESYQSERGTVHVLECSECGRECEHVNGDYEYCPHCLAKNELF